MSRAYAYPELTFHWVRSRANVEGGGGTKTVTKRACRAGERRTCGNKRCRRRSDESTGIPPGKAVARQARVTVWTLNRVRMSMLRQVARARCQPRVDWSKSASRVECVMVSSPATSVGVERLGRPSTLGDCTLWFNCLSIFVVYSGTLHRRWYELTTTAWWSEARVFQGR